VWTPAGNSYQGPGWFSPDGKVLLVIATKDGRATLMAVDVARGRGTVLGGWGVKAGGFVAQGWASDGKTFFFTAIDAQGGGRVYTYLRGARSVIATKVTVSPFDAASVAP